MNRKLHFPNHCENYLAINSLIYTLKTECLNVKCCQPVTRLTPGSRVAPGTPSVFPGLGGTCCPSPATSPSPPARTTPSSSPSPTSGWVASSPVPAWAALTVTSPSRRTDLGAQDLRALAPAPGFSVGTLVTTPGGLLGRPRCLFVEHLPSGSNKYNLKKGD